MSMCLIYDDRTDVSPDIQALLGVQKFSQVLYRKRSLLDHVRALVRDAGIPEFIHLHRDSDLADFSDRLHRAPAAESTPAIPPRRFLYYPSNVIPRRLEDAKLFLQKLRYARRDIYIPVEDATPSPDASLLLWVGEQRLRELLEPLAAHDLARVRRAAQRSLASVGSAGDLTDLSRYDRFVEFLSSNFDVRHFNAVEHDALSVIKRSPDVQKIKREYTFLSLVDGPVLPFFLRPFAYEEEVHAGVPTASYRLERLNVPDMAIQWVHGAFSLSEFSGFLDKVETYFRVRPARACAPQGIAKASHDLYAGKISDRMDRMRTLPQCEVLAQMLARAAVPTSLELLAQRWRNLASRIGPMDRSDGLAFTHGDPCFSNILYDRRVQQLKFIDPRGATTPDDLFAHPYYDAAKLSHSVLGGYDFINHNLFELELDTHLRLSLTLAAPDLREHQRAFARRMAELGFDYRVMRLYEASLFLSMLPLHADVPKKTVAFALTAGAIMDELETLA
ncbi:MAG: hypothetical protein U0637_08495 [Phycisphaerales bacterium]